MINQRWKNAQKAEKKFWQSSGSMNHINEKYWCKMINHGFNLNYEFFTNKDVLEIGCGATGIIFFLKNAKSRVGIEPMDMNQFIDSWKKPFVRKGIGEELPFDNNSFDVVICFNVLDHTLNPAKVIQEIHRVLRNKADCLLWLHTLRNQYKFVQGILNKVDTPHPHHFTLNEILTLVLNNNTTSFEVKKKNIFKGIGFLREQEKIQQQQQHHSTLKKHVIKVSIANRLLNDVWLWLRKS
jgi:ubiquinone/menaquinone biosynthesis C-methylase UbiE